MKTLILLFITQSTFNSAGSFSLKNISPFNRDRIIADTALDSSEPSYLEDLDLWARGKNVEGLNIKVSKLVHNTDKEALFTIKAEYSNPDIEDKVFHIIKEPGEITRKYNFIGYGFNGIGGEKFDNFIRNTMIVGLAVTGVEALGLDLILSGQISHSLYDFISADATNKEIITTTGFLSVILSKIFEYAAEFGEKGLNPFYYFETVRIFSVGDKEILYTDLPMSEVLARLDNPYKGMFSRNKGLNENFSVEMDPDYSLDMVVPLKKALLKILHKRSTQKMKPRNLGNYDESTDPKIVINIEKINFFSDSSQISESELSKLPEELKSVLSKSLEDYLKNEKLKSSEEFESLQSDDNEDHI